MIAGLEEITGGEIAIDGRVVNRLEPRERDIAMVFQNYALYPHMSVAENIVLFAADRACVEGDHPRQGGGRRRHPRASATSSAASPRS